MANRVLDLLKRTDIFARLPEPELAKIGRLLREKKVSRDDVLFYEGDRGDAMYIVSQGRVKISQQDGFGAEHVLAFYGEGEFFGDMALLSGSPRSGTAQAITPVRVLQLRKDDFDVLLAGNLDLMKEMLRVLATRQAAANQRLSHEADEGTAGTGYVTLVFSPAGGTGKTTLALNLAIALAQIVPDRSVLVDLSLTFGHAPILLNLNPRTAMSAMTPTAMRSLDRDSFMSYLSRHDVTSLQVLIGSLRPEDGETVAAEHVHAAIEVLRARFVHVVVDAPSNFSDAVLAAVELANRVIILGLPDPHIVDDMRETARIFGEILHLPPDRMAFALNHRTPYAGMEVKAVEETLGRPLAFQIPYGSEQPALAARDGYPLQSQFPGNPVSQAIAELADDIAVAAKEAVALAPR